MVQSGIDLITNAMDEIRELSTALVETSQEEKSLVHTLDHLMDHLMATGALNVQKKIRLPDESLIESKVKTTVIRIVQEQLANVMKHSDARNLFIELSFRDHNLYLSVKDDGKGFHLRDIQQGMGFQNMRSRVAFMNGSLHIHSSPGDGCQIEVHIPVRKVRMRDDGEREVDS